MVALVERDPLELSELQGPGVSHVAPRLCVPCGHPLHHAHPVTVVLLRAGVRGEGRSPRVLGLGSVARESRLTDQAAHLSPLFLGDTELVVRGPQDVERLLDALRPEESVPDQPPDEGAVARRGEAQKPRHRPGRVPVPRCRGESEQASHQQSSRVHRKALLVHPSVDDGAGCAGEGKKMRIFPSLSPQSTS